MTPDASSVLGQVTWSEEIFSLFDLLKTHELPLLVKVHKGQYLNIGPGGLSSLGVHSTLLLTSGGRRRRLVAQGVKFKDNRRLVSVGQKLLIPDTFEGFFEILSEEGRSVRAIESVAELTRLFPDSCIVRCNCKAYVSKSDSVETITERSRTIQSGETLVLVGEVSRPRGRGPARFLRCFDSSGENVYLPHEQKAKFSAVAKEESISGVHSVGNLLNKRLPLNVRLVSGRPADGPRLGGSSFVPELRVHTTYEDELVVALPLHKDSVVVTLPTTAPLRLQVASNGDALARSAEFARLCDRAAQVWLHGVDRMHAFDIPLPKDPRFDGKAKAAPRPRGFRRSISAPMSRVTRRHSGQTVDEYDEIDQIYDYVRGFAPMPRDARAAALGHSAPEPGPQTATPRRPQATSHATQTPPAPQPTPVRASDQPPEPPPIETIPSRRLSLAAVRPFNLHPGVFSAKKPVRPEPPPDNRVSAEKRAREAAAAARQGEPRPAGKLFAKNCNARANQRFAAHRNTGGGGINKCGSVHGPLPDAVRSTVRSIGPSPLFDLRYKSLTNLLMDCDTLDSSNSGGKTSGDSGDSALLKGRILEKKPRKLTRPKSLTNLAWDTHAPAPEMFSKPSIITDHERKLRLEPGVYTRRSHNILLNNKYNNLKKIGTLYL